MNSLRSRITALSVLALAVVLALAAILIVSLVDRQLSDELAAQREQTVQDLVERIQDGEDPRQIRMPVGTDGSEYALLDSAGNFINSTVIFTSGPDIFDEIPPDGTIEVVDVFVDSDEFDSQFLQELFSDVTIWEETSTSVIGADGAPYEVLAFTSIDVVERSVNQVRSVLLLVIPILAVVFGGLVWLLTGRVLRPVDEITRRAGQISSETLHQRLDEPGTNDEIDRLAKTLNTMLDRLDRGATQQRQFVSDASHELQSPLTVMIGEAELAAQDNDPEELAAANALVVEHGKRMSAMIHDLLDLARSSEAEIARTDVDLDDVLRDQARLHSRAVVTTRIQPVRIRGDERSLGRLFRNLMDNGSRYADSVVEVSCSASDGLAVVFVDDDGPGIPVANRDQIFERFTRLDASRTRSTGGTGLGLAIAQAIAESHGGTISVHDSPLGGCRMRVELPTM